MFVPCMYCFVHTGSRKWKVLQITPFSACMQKKTLDMLHVCNDVSLLRMCLFVCRPVTYFSCSICHLYTPVPCSSGDWQPDSIPCNVLNITHYRCCAVSVCERIWFSPVTDCRVLGFENVDWALSICQQLTWLTAKNDDYVQVSLERWVRGFHHLLGIVTSFKVLLSSYAVPWVSLSSVTLIHSHFISLKPWMIPWCHFINRNADKRKISVLWFIHSSW